jgi:hypothetical protein
VRGEGLHAGLLLTWQPGPACFPPRPFAQVKEVSENPLAKVSELVRGSSDGGGKKRRRRRAGGSRADLHGDKALETQILESSIHKICSLLSVRRCRSCRLPPPDACPPPLRCPRRSGGAAVRVLRAPHHRAHKPLVRSCASSCHHASL